MSDSWQEVSLAELCDKPTYGLIASASDEDVGPRFIRQTDIVRGEVDWSTVPFCEASATDIEKFGVQVGDLLVSRLGAGVGNTAHVEETHGAVFAGYLVRFQPIPSVLHHRFAKYVLHSPSWYQHVEATRSGAAQPTLNAKQMGRFRFLLPPLDEQRRIARVLGALDDLIDTDLSLMRALAARQAAAFRRAWNGETRAPLGSVAKVTMGQSPPGSSYNEAGEGVAFYQGTRDFGWRFPANRVWTTEPKRLADAGSTLVAVRAPVGELNIAVERTALGRGVAGLSSRGRQASLFQALQVDLNLWDAHQGTGTVFASINKIDMASLSVPWVDDDLLEQQLQIMDAAILELHREAESLTHARDELLPLLVSGRVRVRDLEGAV